MNRRQFLQAASLCTVAYLANPAATFGQSVQYGKILAQYSVPREVRQFSIDEVVKALQSDIPTSQGNYIPLFIDFLQKVHFEITGMTYPQHIEETFGIKNPTHIAIFDRISIDGKVEVAGKFIHGEKEEENRVALNGVLNPTETLFTLNHEMVHGIKGVGEVYAAAHTHRDVCYMAAHYPEILALEGNRRDSSPINPLSHLIKEYLTSVEFDSEGRFKVVDKGDFGYMVLLYNTFDVEAALDVLNNLRFSFQDEFAKIGVEGLSKDGKGFFQKLQDNFLDMTKDFASRERTKHSGHNH